MTSERSWFSADGGSPTPELSVLFSSVREAGSPNMAQIGALKGPESELEQRQHRAAALIQAAYRGQATRGQLAHEMSKQRAEGPQLVPRLNLLGVGAGPVVAKHRSDAASEMGWLTDRTLYTPPPTPGREVEDLRLAMLEDGKLALCCEEFVLRVCVLRRTAL